jgi:hypothetical protein
MRVANQKDLQLLNSTIAAQKDLISAVFLKARRASNDMRLRAIQELWNAMLQVVHGVPPIVETAADLATTPEVYQHLLKFQSDQIPGVEEIYKRTIDSEGAIIVPAEKARLLAGEYLFALHYAYNAFLRSLTTKVFLDNM